MSVIIETDSVESIPGVVCDGTNSKTGKSNGIIRKLKESLESFWMENEIELSKGNLLAIFKRISKEYSMSFDIKPTNYGKGSTSVIRLTIGDNSLHNGDRIPAIFFYTNMMDICSLLNNIEKCVSTQIIELGSWSTLEISQKFVKAKYMYSVQLNGTNIVYAENAKATEFFNVKLYVSDPWYDAQPGFIRKIKVWNGISELWSQWSEWSTCNSSCVTTRSHICLNCIKKKFEFETESCNFLYEVYWSSWSSCKVTNGNGVMSRTKLFNVVNDTSCGNNNVKECFEIFWMENEIELSKGNLLATFKRISKEYSISFDIKPIDFLNEWTNVICLTLGNYNSRIPAVHFPGNYPGVVRICFLFDDNKCFFTKPIELEYWSTFLILQKFVEGKYMFLIQLNGTNITYITNKNATEFENVKLYVSDPWFNAQPGFIRNIKICNGNPDDFLMEQETPLSKGNLVATFNQFYREFQVYFELKPTSFSDLGLNYSVIHLTTGTNDLIYGDRNPALWFESANIGCMAIYSCLNRQFDYIITNPVQPETWSSVKISQELLNGNYIYSVQLNGTIVYNKQNNDAQEFSNFKVYVSDPWYEAQPGFIRNLKITNVKPDSFKNQRNASDIFAVIYRTRWCNVQNDLEWGFKKKTEIKNCPVNQTYPDTRKPFWNVTNIVSFKGNVITLNLLIYPTFESAIVNIEFEYFLPPFFSWTLENVIQRFAKTDVNRLKYAFNGEFHFVDSFNYTFIAIFNDSTCPLPGKFTLEVPLKATLQVGSDNPIVITKTYQKVVNCFIKPKLSIVVVNRVFKESYGRGIYWDNNKSHIYVCMSQHMPNTTAACYHSNNNGYLWDNLDAQVGSILGHHTVTNELYAIHRNRKTYIMFHNIHKKWLALTVQQFNELASHKIDPAWRKNLEGDYEQVYTLGPNDWLGNGEGLFYRKHGETSWIQRVKWV